MGFQSQRAGFNSPATLQSQQGFKRCPEYAGTKYSKLRVKIKSLAAEARIIRAEERKHPGESLDRHQLHNHRVWDVRREARFSQIAYGFLRGRAYSQIEQPKNKPLGIDDADYAFEIAWRFGERASPQEKSDVKRQFRAWCGLE